MEAEEIVRWLQNELSWCREKSTEHEKLAYGRDYNNPGEHHSQLRVSRLYEGRAEAYAEVLEKLGVKEEVDAVPQV